ncbi:hypothetical protein MEQU1_002735 [Malassezia equina]|uniref:Transmembrane protein n=1 Tax=Malassezia equina TaxID=1381935 RepID=A0AAF0J118_9BASI|nr:hypothetical protein MEQU1_002735 [Malassezia equina]
MPPPAAEADGERPAPRVCPQHVAALSAAVFVAGAVGTVMYGVWRRPAWTVIGPAAAAKDAASRAVASPTPPNDAPKSAWALFGEMNAAIFRRGARPPLTEAPTTSPLRALSRRAQPPQGATTRSAAPTSEGPLRALSRSNTGPVPEPVARMEDLDNDGALMAVRAFAVATALVGAGAACTAFLLRATLGVRSMEELADTLHMWMPSLRPPAALERYLPVIPRDASDNGATTEPNVAQRLEATDDVMEWLHLARLQLDAEMATHTAERLQRMEARMKL